MSKRPWFSKTLWLNLITALLAVAAEAIVVLLAAISELLPLLDHMTLLGLSEATAEQVRAALLIVNVVANFILRLITKQPLAVR